MSRHRLRAALLLAAAVSLATACSTADAGRSNASDPEAAARASRASAVAESVASGETSIATAPPAPTRVTMTCYLNGTYTDSQQFTMDVGGDFAPIWAAAPTSCDATRDLGAFTPVEQQAVTTAGYPSSASITTLYEICARVDPNDVYIQPSHTLSAGQIAEVNGMLTLCPGHPHAQQLRDAAARSQADAAAEAAGELIHSGTYLVGSEIKPGTYVIEQASKGCYWERLDATGEIIDNNFIGAETRVQVTIRASDYSFHNEDCGTWRKVG